MLETSIEGYEGMKVLMDEIISLEGWRREGVHESVITWVRYSEKI